MRILFCGLSGIPNKASASINRYMALGQALSENNEIIYINRFPLFRSNDTQSFEKNHTYQIIDASNVKYRPSSFFKRNFIKLASFIYEFKTIRKLHKEKKIDWLNIYTQYFGIFMAYYIYSKIFKFKTVLHYVELRSSFNERSIPFRINDLLFDKIAIKLCDKIIPISTTLNNYVLSLKPTAQTLIVPPICDFDYFASIEPETTYHKYFVFCSSITYDEVILFVINSFLNMKEKDVSLHLVINGKIGHQEIEHLIENNKNRIYLFSNLKYEELIAKYKGALAELIPLRNSMQDCARFPQKICEFLASKRPIITTSYGEIKNYFQDKKNAIISEKFEVETYSEQLDWAVKNQNNLNSISEESYRTGYNHFNIKSYSSKIDDFLRIS
jgi:glycosyltransferase involved in cell wall biosynthesis